MYCPCLCQQHVFPPTQSCMCTSVHATEAYTYDTPTVALHDQVKHSGKDRPCVCSLHISCVMSLSLDVQHDLHATGQAICRASATCRPGRSSTESRDGRWYYLCGLGIESIRCRPILACHSIVCTFTHYVTQGWWWGGIERPL